MRRSHMGVVCFCEKEGKKENLAGRERRGGMEECANADTSGRRQHDLQPGSRLPL